MIQKSGNFADSLRHARKYLQVLKVGGAKVLQPSEIVSLENPVWKTIEFVLEMLIAKIGFDTDENVHDKFDV